MRARLPTAVLILASLAAACSGQVGGIAADGADDGDDGDDGVAGADASLAPADAGAPGPDAFAPEAIPALSDEPAPDCGGGPADHFQFLDDTCAAKRLPAVVDRGFRCPTTDVSAEVTLADGRMVRYQRADEVPVVEAELTDLVPGDLDLAVILVRRVGGVPHFRYLSNGRHARVFQPWSTSKWIAAANAGAHLRELSGGAVGLDATAGAHALGDLVTSVVSYDDAPYSSNALGRWFHDVGGRARANALVHDAWLHRGADESFGGNYGAAAPPVGYAFVGAGGATLSVTPDATAGPANRLSAFSLADALRRLVLWREVPALAFPGLADADHQVLLYGAEGSAKGAFGGLSADTAIYLQAGHDIDYLDRRARGAWRVFSKLGLGTASEFVTVSYGCFPVLDGDGAPVPGWGRELIIAAHLPTGGATWAARDRLLARAIRAIMLRVIDGRL